MPKTSTTTMNIISKFALILSAFFLSSTRMDPFTSTTTSTTTSSFSSSSSSSVVVAHALSQSIVVVGLNAALQKRFVLPPGADLVPGNVHRASKCDTGVGGKGQDVGVALSCLMRTTMTTTTTTTKEEGGGLTDIDIDGRGGVILAQFLGAGAEGDAVSMALTSKHGLIDESLTVRNAAPLRTCTTIVGANCATELVETSGMVTSDEMSTLCDGIDELTRRSDGAGGRGGGRADCVCVMGSMPPGCPEDTYADLVRRLADSGSLVLVDSVIGLGPLLKTLKSIFENDENENEYDGDGDSSNAAKGDGGGGGGGAVLKLNAAELCKLGGVVRTSGGESCRVSHDELSSAARGFVSRYDDAVGALEYLCVTDGKFPGYVVEVPRSGSSSSSSSSYAGSFRTWRLPPVDLSDRGTLYPIGAGDTVSAGTMAAMQHLRRSRGGRRFSSDRGRVVVPPDVGGLLSEKCAEWAMIGSGGDDDAGAGMAAAFAFGLACGSASCLREDNSVFDVDDAVAFFGGMAKPVFISIPAMDPVAS